MFVAAAIKELRQCVLPTMVFLVSHYTMVAISQQAGEYGSPYRNGCREVEEYGRHFHISQKM
jgi:transformation/transcription domain-associated protein